jgi:hypothetical protein
MQLTKLRAAPVLQAEVPPCAPASKMDGGTASQLIASVGWTRRGMRGRNDIMAKRWNSRVVSRPCRRGRRVGRQLMRISGISSAKTGSL